VGTLANALLVVPDTKHTFNDDALFPVCCKITMCEGGLLDAAEVQSLPELSFKNPNRRKRPKLNVYTPPNPDAPSVHASYTFVSRNQGFDVRRSHILGSSQPAQQVDTHDASMEEAPLNYNFDCYSEPLEGQELVDVEVEADNNKRKRTASVSVPRLV
jgi:hypothetical protein